MTTAKFRPVLTATQIDWIVTHARSTLDNDPTNYVAKSIVASLGVFAYKVETGLVKPASIVHPKVSMYDSLGFSESVVDTTSDAYRWTNNLMTPEEELEYENSLNQIAKGA